MNNKIDNHAKQALVTSLQSDHPDALSITIDDYIDLRIEKEVARMKEYPYGYFKKPNFPKYKKNKNRKK